MPHETIILDEADTRRLLPMRDCIEAMRGAFLALASGDADQPLRSILWLKDRRGGLGLMPGAIEAADALAAKVVSVFPSNTGSKCESHQGVVILFETAHGRPLAIVDAGVVTSVRTAAVSALATDLLARPDCSTLALLGAGAQARSHLTSMLIARPFERVRLWSLHEDAASRFAEWAKQRVDSCPPIEMCATPERAVRDADVVCTLTASKTPVLKGAWLAPGTHINAVGACTPDARELDTEAVRRARLFVDRLESALTESGDFLLPHAEGAIDASHIVGELGDLVAGRGEGRRSEDEITLFDSLGLAVEDVAAVRFLCDAAAREGAGLRVRFQSEREA